jgi:hypothetical protein
MCASIEALILNKVYSKGTRSHCMYFLYGKYSWAE